MEFLLALAGAAALNDLWELAPDRLLRLLGRRWRITAPAAHEWLCPALGCRCSALR